MALDVDAMGCVAVGAPARDTGSGRECARVIFSGEGGKVAREREQLCRQVVGAWTAADDAVVPGSALPAALGKAALLEEGRDELPHHVGGAAPAGAAAGEALEVDACDGPLAPL